VVIAPVIYKFSGATLIALATLCFGLAFIVAYGVLGILTVVAPSWVNAQRVMLIGIVRNVPNGKSIQIQSDLWEVGHAFIKREHKSRRLGAALALQPLKRTEPGCARARTRSASWSFFGLALAQGAGANADLVTKLQSDDVFTRRDARIALSKKTDDDLKLLAS